MVKKKNKKMKKKILIVISLVIGIILLLISLNTNRKTNFIESIFKDIVIFPSKVVSKNNDKDAESYLLEKNENDELRREIDELRGVLELNNTMSEYTKINTTIISRNKSYWFNTLTIDKGSSSGIKKDMAVITRDGLIGKISKVYKHSSEVKMITSDDLSFKVSIAIKTNDTDSYAILNGYNKKNSLIKAVGIDKTTNINVGDAVVTSGLSDMFPGGIYIGTVEKIKSDKYNLSKIVYIKTKQNFNDLHYLTVLKVD